SVSPLRVCFPHVSPFFFLLLLPPPPRSPLFPYTTLFRSFSAFINPGSNQLDLCGVERLAAERHPSLISDSCNALIEGAFGSLPWQNHLARLASDKSRLL